MEVNGIYISKADEIADASIVSGVVDGSGNLVLTNGGGAEFNAGQVVIPATDPGSAVFSTGDFLVGAAQTAGLLWRTGTFSGAPTIVETGNQFSYSNQGLIVEQFGVYDVQVSIQSPPSYADSVYFGVRMFSSPFIGSIDQIVDARPNPPGSLTSQAQIQRRMSIQAGTLMTLQVLADNDGSTAWSTDWNARIAITKSW
jgi:hypothetical protein